MRYNLVGQRHSLQMGARSLHDHQRAAGDVGQRGQGLGRGDGGGDGDGVYDGAVIGALIRQLLSF